MRAFLRKFFSPQHIDLRDPNAIIQGHLDLPSEGEFVQPLDFRVQGWAATIDPRREVSAIKFMLDGEWVGQCELTQARPDVAAQLHLDAGRKTGFVSRFSLPAHAHKVSACLSVWAVLDRGELFEISKRHLSLTPLQGSLDVPAPEGVSDPLTFLIQGWVRTMHPERAVRWLDFTLDDKLIDETQRLHARPEKAVACGFDSQLKVGFSRVVSLPAFAEKKSAILAVWAVLDNGERFQLVARKVLLTGKDYRKMHYGQLIDPAVIEVQKRSDIYGSGPSLEEGSAELVALLKRELAEDCHSVLDVGCGLGYYGRCLRAAGYEWLGVEVKEDDVRRLNDAGLPNVHVSGKGLPFPDRSFDAGICIEVLEHIEGPEPFLKEIARVVRNRLLISVPNAELIPYLSPYAAVPWHMLEGDHKNFFTRASLEALLRKFFDRVEVQLYARHPLATPEGSPLYYNLFAIAEHA